MQESYLEIWRPVFDLQYVHQNITCAEHCAHWSGIRMHGTRVKMVACRHNDCAVTLPLRQVQRADPCPQMCKAAGHDLGNKPQVQVFTFNLPKICWEGFLKYSSQTEGFFFATSVTTSLAPITQENYIQTNTTWTWYRHYSLSLSLKSMWCGLNGIIGAHCSIANSTYTLIVFSTLDYPILECKTLKDVTSHPHLPIPITLFDHWLLTILLPRGLRKSRMLISTPGLYLEPCPN